MFILQLFLNHTTSLHCTSSRQTKIKKEDWQMHHLLWPPARPWPAMQCFPPLGPRQFEEDCSKGIFQWPCEADYQWYTAQKPPTTPITASSNPLHSHTHNIKPKPAFKVKLIKVTSPASTTVVQDIIALKWAFLDTFDTIGNMPGTYTIRTDPTVTPV